MRRQRRAGQAILSAYIAVVVLTVLGGSVLNHSLAAHRISERQQLQAETLYLAEGAIEDAAGKFSDAIANFTVDENVARYPAAGTTATTYSDGTVSNWFVQQSEAAPRAIVDPDGTTVFEKNYEIVATVTHPLVPGVTTTLHQVISRRIIYTFQHAVFYDNDLEWHPGADMELTGRVHSNNDLYLSAYSGKTLTIDSEYLRAAGNLYHRRKDDGTVPTGTVEILKAGSSPAVFPVLNTDSTSGTWTATALSTWNGTVQTAPHGVTKRAVPVVGSTSVGGFYDTNAGVKVVNGTVTDGSGTPLTVPPGTISTTTSMYNMREGKTVRMTEIDMGKLAGYYDCSGDGVPEPPQTGCNTYTNQLPSNGLIYATRTDALSTEQPGIRLLNGTAIYRNNGLTVVSNDPMYIKGDFNTVSKKPVAVIGDALHVLSNSWNDANSASGISSRVASTTTVNSAFIAGIKPTPTGGGTYSGGLENYPRMQEDWANKYLNITGSFVSLWNSQIATGNWPGTGGVYKAPKRVWNYDTSFSSGTSLPPFTPRAVEINRGAWWKE